MDEPARRLPLDPLRGFLAAAQRLSFTHAAESLHLTQSAVSRQVQALEQALGVRLFERRVRELRLTPAGERLQRAAARWLAEYAEFARALREDERRRPVIVTASIGIAALWLVPRLAQFQQAHPQLDVRIAAGNRVLDLAREQVDVAIRYCADRDAPEGAWRLFGESVLPLASPALGLRRLDRESLARSVLLEFEDPRYPWLRWDDWLAASGLADAKPRARLTFSHYDQLIQAAIGGQGVAIGRAELIGRWLEEGTLVPLGEGSRSIEGRGFWLLLAEPAPREQVRLFADWVRAEAAGSPSATPGAQLARPAP